MTTPSIFIIARMTGTYQGTSIPLVGAIDSTDQPIVSEDEAKELATQLQLKDKQERIIFRSVFVGVENRTIEFTRTNGLPTLKAANVTPIGAKGKP